MKARVDENRYNSNEIQQRERELTGKKKQGDDEGRAKEETVP